MLSRASMSPDALVQEIGLLLGHVGQPEETGSVIAFLSDSGARYVTGRTLRPNGGAVMT